MRFIILQPVWSQAALAARNRLQDVFLFGKKVIQPGDNERLINIFW